jgi:hypothetical protein
MSNKITNPFLKQLISGISQKATQGRITGVDWNILEEAKKRKKVAKKTLKKESDEKKPSQQPEDRYEWENDPYHSRQFEKSDVSWREYDKKMNPESYRVKEADEKKKPADDVDSLLGDLGGGGDADQTGGSSAPEKKSGANAGAANPTGADGAGAPPDGGKEDAGDDAPAGLGGEEGGTEEDSEEAQSDAAEAKAELEKAKAEKDKAEKEIKKHSYIKLGSNSGTQFLISKILDHAFKTNTIDALAGEMVQKLKISTPQDISAFSEETASYRVIPGFPELLSSMKTMATKQPEETSEA